MQDGQCDKNQMGDRQRRHEQQWLTSSGYTVDGDVGSFCQCCPQLFKIFAEDVTPSRARAPRGLDHPSALRVEGVDGVGRMAVWRPE